MSAGSVAGAFLGACRLDVAVRKPGNVSMASPGHGMTAAQFVAAAEAAVGPLCEPGARVGRRIARAVAASVAAAGCNANLGIVLLAAPIAAASERPGALADREALCASIAATLAALDLADTRDAYTAIALANPGGLGSAPEQDVHSPPTLALRDAMALAAHRDRIAWLYAIGYDDLFALDWPALESTEDRSRVDSPPSGGGGRPWPPPEDAFTPPQAGLHAGVQRLYLEIVSRWPDSHIVRKHGAAVAQNVMVAAQPWVAIERPDDDPRFALWDAELKAAAINPGTSADLTVATMMLAGLVGPGAMQWHGT